MMTGKNRRVLLRDALRYWLRQEAETVLLRKYEYGYRRRPEGKREVSAAEAAAVHLLAAMEW